MAEFEAEAQLLLTRWVVAMLLTPHASWPISRPHDRVTAAGLAVAASATDTLN
eukprot:COSAG01_NODE_363_length_18113_cov_45.041690_5_plen_53_part_00